MDPAEFITLSSKLVAMGRAGARSAISRAYYGAFHLALEALAEFRVAPAANGRAHNLVPLFLDCADSPHADAAASSLKDLYTKRIAVDYRLSDADVETLEHAKL